MGQNKLNDIQWLRAIAAFEVIFWHSDLITKHFSSWSLQASAYQDLGGFGVKLFFIISGYIICMRAPSYKTPADFFLSRILRLYPLYWMVTAMALLAYFINPSWNQSRLIPDFANITQSFLIFPQYRGPIFAVGWTLEIEMVFYAMVALFAFLAGGLNSRAKLNIAIIFAVLGFIGFALGSGHSKSVWDYHIFSPYFLAFGFGWLIRVLEEQGGIEENKQHVAGFALLVVASAAVVSVPALKSAYIAIVLSMILFVVFRQLRAVFQTKNSLNEFMSLAGDASYSLYLTHWFVLSISGKMLGLTDMPGELDPLLRLIGFILSGVVGIVIFIYIEKPIDRRLRGRQASTPGSGDGAAIHQKMATAVKGP